MHASISIDRKIMDMDRPFRISNYLSSLPLTKLKLILHIYKDLTEVFSKMKTIVWYIWQE